MSSASGSVRAVMKRMNSNTGRTPMSAPWAHSSPYWSAVRPRSGSLLTTSTNRAPTAAAMSTIRLASSTGRSATRKIGSASSATRPVASSRSTTAAVTAGVHVVRSTQMPAAGKPAAPAASTASAGASSGTVPAASDVRCTSAQGSASMWAHRAGEPTPRSCGSAQGTWALADLSGGALEVGVLDAQLTLEHLAAHVARQRLVTLDDEAGQLVGAEGGAAGVQDDDRVEGAP